MNKKKILCVEDNPGTTELISFVLTDFDVVIADTVMEARKMIAKEKYELILLDYALPDGTGAALCSKIRSFDRRTPILFFTAHSTFTETDARQLGANGTLHKHHPHFTNELLERARELVAA